MNRVLRLVFLVLITFSLVSASPAGAAEQGYWEMKGGMPEIENFPGTDWEQRNGWIGKIFSHDETHIDIGFRFPSVNHGEWSRVRLWWDRPANILIPETIVPARAGRTNVSNPQDGSKGIPSISLDGDDLLVHSEEKAFSTHEERNTKYKVPGYRSDGNLQIKVNCLLSSGSGSVRYFYRYIWRAGKPPAGSSGNTSTTGTGDSGSDSALKGQWTFDGNGYPGSLLFTVEDGNPVVQMYYEVTKKWEQMTNVRFDSNTGEISFTRPWSGNPTFQQYRGKLVGGVFRGTFTDSNSPGQKFPWAAKP